MPYFITDSSPDCSGWATIKDDGEVIGCHTSKQDAIDQMVAVSLAEDIEVGGERALPDNYRPSLSENVPEGRACGNCIFYMEDNIKEYENGELRAWCAKWEDYVNGAYYCNAWQGELNNEEDGDSQMRAEPDALNVGDFVAWGSSGGRARGRIVRIVRDGSINVPNADFTIEGTEDDPAALIRIYRPEGNGWEATETLVGHKFSTLRKIDDLPENTEEENSRAINQEPPAYMRAAARRGLEYYAEGLAGDGLTDKTVREARLMAQGQVSDDKWIRIAAWIARHMPDLDAPQNSNPSDDGYPGGGLVAHLLWGSGPSKRAARRTMEYAQGVVERIRAEENAARYKTIGVKLTKEQKDKSLKTVERRVKNNIDFEIRLEPQDSEGMRFAGYAAVFNSPSEPLPFTEFIEPGAFKRSLKSRNEIKMFMNHNMDMVLASTRSKTLRLAEDSKGLLAEAVLPDTTVGRDLSVLMKRGDVHSMSFGFSVPAKGERWNNEGTERYLKEIRLHEVSIVTGFPAYEATTASVRSLDILATRTNVDVDALADALTSLESGQELKPDQAGLINEVVAKLTTVDSTNSLEIKRQQLDLLMKAV
jgi:HK97 family phage prohead protease